MLTEKVSKEQVVKNSFWKFLESVGVQVVQLIVTVILARLLGPNDYGLMALVLVSINFLGLFVNSSIASYLIYLHDIKKQDFLTILVSNLFVSIILFVILYFASGSIAEYYNTPILASLLHLMAIVLPLNSVSAVYNAYAMKMSMFKILFIRNMIALPSSGMIALITAFCGMGVWALVLQQVTYSLLLCIIVVVSIKIKLDGLWQFEIKKIVPMSRYGGMAFLSAFVAFISDSFGDLLIGKRINSEQLGFYNRGNHFPNTICSVVNNIVAGVMFPAFTSYNSNLKELKSKYSKSIRILCYMVLPLFLGMTACAEPMIKVVLSETWLESVPVVQIICISCCVLPLLQTNSQITLATGHLKLRIIGEIIKMVLTIIALLALIDYGIIAVAFVRLLVNCILMAITLIINNKIFGYGLVDFAKDLYKPLLLGLLIFTCIYPIPLFSMSDLAVLALQLLVGTVVYILVIKLFHISDVNEILSLIIIKLAGRR